MWEVLPQLNVFTNLPTAIIPHIAMSGNATCNCWGAETRGGQQTKSDVSLVSLDGLGLGLGLDDRVRVGVRVRVRVR